MAQVTFKALSNEDVPALLSMMQDFYAIDNYPFDADAAQNLAEQFINNNSLGKGWLILYNEKVAGYVILTYVFSFEYKGMIAFLDELYISPDYRNNGLGKKAVDYTIKAAREDNIRLIYLELEEHNTIARTLYLNKGFTIHDRQILKLKP